MTEKIFISSIILILSTQVQNLYQRERKQIEMKGTVKFFNSKKGFGFIVDEGGMEHFVHYSNIQMDGYKKLRKGQGVTFDVGTREDGKTEAVQVTPIAAAEAV